MDARCEFISCLSPHEPAELTRRIVLDTEGLFCVLQEAEVVKLLRMRKREKFTVVKHGNAPRPGKLVHGHIHYTVCRTPAPYKHLGIVIAVDGGRSNLPFDQRK